jgi:hypothetical protein
MPNPTDLCDLAYVRTAMELDDDETSRDTRIEQLITPASDAIIAEVNRELAPQTANVTRRVRVDPSKTLKDGTVLVSLAPYDLETATVVTLSPESTNPVVLVAGSDYVFDPEPAKFGVYTVARLSRSVSAQSEMFSRFGFGYLDIHGDWGFPVIPEDAKQACAATIRAWMQSNVSVLAQAPPQAGDVMPIVRTGPIPREALWMLKDLYRQRAF